MLNWQLGVRNNARILLFWMCMWPWAAASELASVTGIPVATVNRNLGRFYEGGWAESRMVGRGAIAKRRWRLTSELLDNVFAVEHRHAGKFRNSDSPQRMGPTSTDTGIAWLSARRRDALFIRLPAGFSSRHRPPPIR